MCAGMPRAARRPTHLANLVNSENLVLPDALSLRLSSQAGRCFAPVGSDNSHFFKRLFTKMAVSMASDPDSESAAQPRRRRRGRAGPRDCRGAVRSRPPGGRPDGRNPMIFSRPRPPWPARRGLRRATVTGGPAGPPDDRPGSRAVVPDAPATRGPSRRPPPRQPRDGRRLHSSTRATGGAPPRLHSPILVRRPRRPPSPLHS
jgi:hypothetical protein